VLASDRSLYPDVAHVVNMLRKKYENRKLQQVFRHWDTDKDGYINRSELDFNLRRQGMRLSPPQLQGLFDVHDTDKDGRLLYTEFVHMICGPIKHQGHHNTIVQAHVRDRPLEVAPDPYQILRNAALDNPQELFDVRKKSSINAVSGD
jgi:EF-hand domain pair